MEGINIIGDVAGRFDELMLLIASMPKSPIVLVGDIVDRGPKSREVVEWAMANEGHVTSIMGNHEEMMIGAYRQKRDDIWLMNGGQQTLWSYGAKRWHPLEIQLREIPEAHIAWIEKRPMFFKAPGLLVTHAPMMGFDAEIEEMCAHPNFLWARETPPPIKDVFQIYGHNCRFREHQIGDGPVYALCIDTSCKKELSGIHFPTMERFDVPYGGDVK